MRNAPGSCSTAGTKRPPRAALVIAILALTMLISPSIAAAQFDFTLTASGPQNVAQGSPLYFVLTAAPGSGTSPTLIPIAVAGLPAGATVSFPDIAQTCCGTSQIYSLSSPVSTAIKINTLATTPLGPAVLTVSVTAGTVTRSLSYPITVTAPPSPMSREPYAAASNVPQLTLWQSNMTTHGQIFCAQLMDPTLTADQKLSATYYDSQRVFYSIRDYTGASSWDTCAQNAQAIYRDAYVIPNDGEVPGYWDFPHGLYENYIRTGDAASKSAVLLLSRNAAYGTSSVGNMSTMVGPPLSREIAYHLMAYLLALELGDSQSPVGEAYVDLALGHIDQWFVSKTFRAASGDDVPPAAIGQFYVQPFMVALTAEALIQSYETRSQDARVAAAVKVAMDWLWANAWSASNQAFWYEVYGPAAGPYQTSSPAGAPDLNLLVAPAFAWLYKQTGNTAYRDRADAIFSGGVLQAWVSGNGKHFNQQYRWSFDYLKWRNPSSVPASPTGLTVR